MMKKTFFLAAMIISLLFQNCCPYIVDCNDDDFVIDPIDSSQYKPVFIDRAEFEKSVLLQDPIPIVTSGKIYTKGNLLFINELRKGFHIYDNTDPSNPIAIKFLAAPGSTDLAIRNETLYINQATDLIALNYDQTNNIVQLTKRVANIFPELRSPLGILPYNVPEGNVVIDWEIKK